ncbi:hypothetical protein BGZ75_001993 [Mortierella antarctica]|nr:hypothetical protein BGZ75_001993 [Mortierella antarctica]
MAVASFIMGLDLHDELDYPGYLGIILAVDGLVVVLYTVAFLTCRSVHIRFFRILLRLIITSMALFGPARALNESLAVFVLMEIEMVCYWRSDEGSEPPLHEELAAPIDIEMGDVADQRKMTAAPDSTPGFGMGLVLQEHLELGRDLTVILVMDCLTIIVYLWVIHSSQKKVHRRMGRIFFRLVMSVLILYGPAKVLHGCWYTVGRRYDYRPGVNFAEEIHCPADTHYADLGTGVLFYYHLLRARCIITLTLAMLVVLEMVAYRRSAEGRRLPQDVELTAPIDIGMGTTTSHQANNTNMTSAAVPAPMLTDADADTLPTYSP